MFPLNHGFCAKPRTTGYRERLSTIDLHCNGCMSSLCLKQIFNIFCFTNLPKCSLSLHQCFMVTLGSSYVFYIPYSQGSLRQARTFLKMELKWCLHRRENNKYLSLAIAIWDRLLYFKIASLSEITNPHRLCIRTFK